MLVTIATSADSPSRWQGKVVELDRFSAHVAIETRDPVLRQGASVWLHFDPPGGGSPLSVAGIISGVGRGGRITVLLSLSPREYNRLRGLPEPPAQRARRAVDALSTLTGVKPIRKPEAPEPRPEPGSSPPGQPEEAPAAVEPDPASLSPMDRVKALAAALEEMVGPRAEPASPGPVEPAEAPAGKVEAQPAPVSPPPVERAGPSGETVVPQPEPVGVSPEEPVEAPAVIESSGEPAWLRPAEEGHAPVELIEPPPEPASVSPPEPVSVGPVEPVEMAAPELEPVSVGPVEPVEAPAVIESSGEPAWLRPAEEGHAPVELIEPPPEPASVSPPEPVSVGSVEPVEMAAPEPEPVSVGPEEPVEAPAAVEPHVARRSLIDRAKALAAALAEMIGSRAEPASPRPVEPAEAPVEMVEPTLEPVEEPAVIESGGEPAWLRPAEEAEAPVELVEPPPEPAEAAVEMVEPTMEPVEAPAVIESGGEPAWLRPAEEAKAPVELVEPPPEPASVSPREQGEMLIIRGDLEGAWKVYYDALRVEPDDLSLWYGLGRTLSRLNRRNETQEIFEYVVSRGDPDSEEVKHARQWLVGAGLLAEPAAPAVPAAPRSRTETWATVRGKVTWGRLEPPREIFLVVQGLDKDGPRSHARVPLGQSYQFGRLPAGTYHLIGGAETGWLWDLRFTVEAGQELVLDLSRHNSTNPSARV